jgi:SAM-dependent methyltransferase
MAALNAWQKWWIRLWPHRLAVRRHVPIFLKACPEPLSGQVLEVGAGRGSTSRRILATFPQVELTATDVDDGALSDLRAWEGKFGRRLRVMQADVLQLPFDRSVFDVVLALNVFWRLSDDEVAKAVRECIRVVRPGGLLGISQSRFVLGSHWHVAAIEEVLQMERCEILYEAKGRYYDVWVKCPEQGVL